VFIFKTFSDEFDELVQVYLDTVLFVIKIVKAENNTTMAYKIEEK